MKYSQLFNISLIATSLFGLSACAGKDTMTVVYESQNCQIQTSELRKLKSVSEIAALKPQVISLSNEDKGQTPASFDVDLDKNHLVLVALGQKSTAGYSLEELAKGAEIKNKIIHIPVSIQKPPGQIAAQVITSPCAVIALDKTSYEMVKWGEESLSLK